MYTCLGFFLVVAFIFTVLINYIVVTHSSCCSTDVIRPRLVVQTRYNMLSYLQMKADWFNSVLSCCSLTPLKHYISSLMMTVDEYVAFSSGKVHYPGSAAEETLPWLCICSMLSPV